MPETKCVPTVFATPANGFNPQTMVGQPECPYERAVRHVERKTGQPRKRWECSPESPHLRRMYALAKRIAKIRKGTEPPKGERIRGPNTRTLTKGQ